MATPPPLDDFKALLFSPTATAQIVQGSFVAPDKVIIDATDVPDEIKGEIQDIIGDLGDLGDKLILIGM